YGVGGDVDWRALEPLRQAGAESDVLRVAAERWVESGLPTGSIEEIEAVLGAGASPRLLAARLANAPPKFTLDSALAERFRQSGADDAFLSVLARRGPEGRTGPAFDLDTVELYLALGVEPARVADWIDA